MRSVKRVAHSVSKGDQLAYEAFKAIGYHVLKANSKQAILTLFEVLGGQLPLDVVSHIVLKFLLHCITFYIDISQKLSCLF